VPLRILVVDDTRFYRNLVIKVLGALPGIEITGTAADGQEALDRIEVQNPDLVILDLEMPVLSGLDVLDALRRKRSPAGVVMFSSVTTRGAQLTLKALEGGAFDFVPKPEGGDPTENLAFMTRELETAVRAFEASRSPKAAPAVPPRQIPRPDVSGKPVDLVVVGVSTGGPQALAVLVQGFSRAPSVPVVVVQHMPATFTTSLAQTLASKVRFPVKEAADGEPLLAGTLYIAPGGRQTAVVRTVGRLHLAVNDDPPVNFCKPAVDYLFRSAASAVVGGLTAVVLTGLGNDGTEGCRFLRDRGARVLVQDEASCVVASMPRSVVQAGLADGVVALDKMAEAIEGTLK
jgi:two-component system chemotaxis response regulator CheB